MCSPTIPTLRKASRKLGYFCLQSVDQWTGRDSRGAEECSLSSLERESRKVRKEDKKQKLFTTKTMQDLQAMYQEQFANFWAKAFPSESCPPLPKKLEDLGLMKQLALREEDPTLFQNLFRSDYSAMPSDVATRLRNNTLWAGDEVVLEKYGWTAKAQEMRAQIEEGRRLALV